MKQDNFFKKILHQDFGAAYYSDFTKHKDPKRKKNYIARHETREDWDKFITPGALSRWILWNKPTIEESLEDYLESFDLKRLPE